MTSAPSSYGKLNSSLMPAQAAKKDSPEEIGKVASQFEALLITQLLQTARGTDGEGWFGTDGEEAGSVVADMSEQVVSNSLAASGGLGLARLVQEGLNGSLRSKQPPGDRP